MLRLESLEVRQGDFALRADFPVGAGRRVGIIGPSGAGKSTLLGAIAGFVPHSGGVYWEDRVISALRPGTRPLSILFQDNNLFPHLTVAQNVGLGLRPDLRLSSAQRLTVAAALERVGLEQMESRLPAALSGGQQSRVALARVLLRARPLLLLDEPFSALGPGLKVEMLELVHAIAEEEGLTVLLVTHDPADAQLICEQTILVAEGEAQPPVDTAALFQDPPEALKTYLSAPRS